MKNNIRNTVVVALLISLSFWLGILWNTFQYTDICLDMGGGMYPQGSKICVVDFQNENI